MSDLDSSRLLIFVSASARVYAREKERSHKLFIKNNCDSRICLSKHVVNYEGLYYGNATKEQYIYIYISSPPDVLIGGIEQSAVITYSLNLLSYELEIMHILLLVVYRYLTVDYLAITCVITAKMYVKGSCVSLILIKIVNSFFLIIFNIFAKSLLG